MAKKFTKEEVKFALGTGLAVAIFTGCADLAKELLKSVGVENLFLIGFIPLLALTLLLWWIMTR